MCDTLGTFNALQNPTAHALEEFRRTKDVYEGNFPEANKK